MTQFTATLLHYDSWPYIEMLHNREFLVKCSYGRKVNEALYRDVFTKNNSSRLLLNVNSKQINCLDHRRLDRKSIK